MPETLPLPPPRHRPGRSAGYARSARAVLGHPALWPVVFWLVPRRWWRRWPPVPVPPREYAEFRLETMYGAGAGPLGDDDLVRYLKWCRRMRASAR